MFSPILVYDPPNPTGPVDLSIIPESRVPMPEANGRAPGPPDLA